MSKLSANLSEIREINRQRKSAYIQDWRANLPEGSQWFPGSTGRPGCKECRGLGYLRQDLPVGHPEFGNLIPCSDCEA